MHDLVITKYIDITLVNLLVSDEMSLNSLAYILYFNNKLSGWKK